MWKYKWFKKSSLLWIFISHGFGFCEGLHTIHYVSASLFIFMLAQTGKYTCLGNSSQTILTSDAITQLSSCRQLLLQRYLYMCQIPQGWHSGFIRSTDQPAESSLKQQGCTWTDFSPETLLALVVLWTALVWWHGGQESVLSVTSALW